MGTKNIKKGVGLAAQLLLSFTLFSFSCTENDTLYLSKEFQLPVEVTPKKEVFNVGDTISININFNKILSDRENTMKYLFEDYNFETSVRIIELTEKSESLAGQPGAIQSFQFINQIGGILPFGSGGGELDLVYSGESYLLSSKMIVRKPGIYSISFNISAREPAQLVDPPGGYDQIIAGVGATFFIVNSGEGLNYHLITQNTGSNFENPSNEDWARPFFAFIVEE